MPGRRSFAFAMSLASLTACATVPVHQAPNAGVQITFDVATAPQQVREQLVAAFSASGLTVATSQPGVVEYHGTRERGVLGYYEVFARALIVPLDCATRVTLFGEETHFENATATQGTATRLGPASAGRALDVWHRLEAVARSVGGDTAAARHRP